MAYSGGLTLQLSSPLGKYTSYSSGCDVGQEKSLSLHEKKSGASKLYIEDVRKSSSQSTSGPAEIQHIYEGGTLALPLPYPNRQEVIEIAEKKGQMLSPRLHRGNDQVRFELTFRALKLM